MTCWLFYLHGWSFFRKYLWFDGLSFIALSLRACDYTLPSSGKDRARDCPEPIGIDNLQAINNFTRFRTTANKQPIAFALLVLDRVPVFHRVDAEVPLHIKRSDKPPFSYTVEQGSESLTSLAFVFPFLCNYRFRLQKFLWWPGRSRGTTINDNGLGGGGMRCIYLTVTIDCWWWGVPPPMCFYLGPQF